MMKKFHLPHREPPMTVIGAMYRGGDDLLLGADSGAMEAMPEDSPGFRSSFERKLTRHPSRSLAWGVSGNATLGMEFGEWLASYETPPTDWLTFRDEIANHLADLNRKQRRLMRRAGVAATSNDLASVLLVGWTPEPVIVEFDDAGHVEDYIPIGFAAIGSGKWHARLAWATLQMAAYTAVPVARFRTIMQTAAMASPDCEVPVLVWRVSESGVSEAVFAPPEGAQGQSEAPKN